MALAKKCDICGSLYENYNAKPDDVDTNGITFLNIRDSGNYSENRKYDCCPECMDGIKHFIKCLQKMEYPK